MANDLMNMDEEDLKVDLSEADYPTYPPTEKMDRETVEILVDDRIATGG